MEQKHRIPLPYSMDISGEIPAFLGDTLWANYQADAEVEFASDTPDTYVEIGVRCSEASQHGFFLRLHANGAWELRYADTLLKNGVIPDFCNSGRHHIGIGALGTLVLCFADGHSLYEVKLDDRPIVRSGNICLRNAGESNRFYRVTAKSLPVLLPSGCYRVSSSSATTSAEGTEIRFYGSGISLLGKAEGVHAAFWIDGKLYSERRIIADSSFPEAFFTLEPLRKGWHTLRMQVLEGNLEFEAYEIPTEDVWPEYDTAHFPSDPLAPKEDKHSTSGLKKVLPVAGAVAGLAIAVSVGSKIKKKK